MLPLCRRRVLLRFRAAAYTLSARASRCPPTPTLTPTRRQSGSGGGAAGGWAGRWGRGGASHGENGGCGAQVKGGCRAPTGPPLPSSARKLPHRPCRLPGRTPGSWLPVPGDGASGRGHSHPLGPPLPLGCTARGVSLRTQTRMGGTSFPGGAACPPLSGSPGSASGLSATSQSPLWDAGRPGRRGSFPREPSRA